MNITKKVACLAALLGIVTVCFAEPFGIVKMTDEMEQADDTAVIGAIVAMLSEYGNDNLPRDPEYRPPTAQDVAKKHNVPPEQMTRILEGLVRKWLIAWEKAEGFDKISYGGAILTLALQFKYFHGPDTPALVRECALSFEDRFIVETYITISGGGGDSVSLVREMIAKGLLEGSERDLLYRHWGRFIGQLKGKGQVADADKILAFMKEEVQTEQYLGSLQQLDKILCAHLEGYADDPRRQPVVKRIKVMEEEARKQAEIMDRELAEFNAGLRRQHEEWKAKYAPSKPAQPPETTEAPPPAPPTAGEGGASQGLDGAVNWKANVPASRWPYAAALLLALGGGVAWLYLAQRNK
ncbi:MAG: hypothetical protein FWG50_09100 [Kiritimatiellaeota bacterium]|nr:hypothetical protein [Kiritimatiellota bacterium]